MLFLIYIFISVIIKIVLKLRFEKILLSIFVSYRIIAKTFLKNKKLKYIYVTNIEHKN